MLWPTFILAESEINLPKVIFGLIFLAIWGLSAIVSWVNKKQQEAKRQRVREELERSARMTPRTVNRPVQRPPPRRIAEGIAQRFPEVLQPPRPAPPPPVPRVPARPRPVPP